MSKILYLSNSIFPVTAPGIRINRVADLLISDGDVVDLFCTNYSASIPLNSSIRMLPFSKNNFVVKNGKRYFLPIRKGNSFTKYVIGCIDIFFPFNTIKRIKEYLKCNKIDIAILYNDFGPLTKRMLRICKRNKILLYQDNTEWYENSRLSAGFIKKMIPIMVNKRITKIDKKLDGVISISRYLYNYYLSNHVRSFLLPPLMTFYQKNSIKKNKCFTIVYAGFAGEKDLLSPLINAVVMINNEKPDSIKLIIIGTKIDAERCDNSIVAYDKMPHDDVVGILKESDLGVLLRNKKRYAQAGYSTKFAECMSLGVPMLCTKVGGCDLDVVDKVNGFLIDDNEPNTLHESLQFILEMYKNNFAKYTEIKNNCFETAKKLFDAENYKLQLKKFLLLK